MEDNNIKEKKHFFHKKEKQAELATVPKKKKKVWLIVLIIVAIVVVLIGSAVKNMTSQIETAVNTVEIEPVEKRDLSDSVSLKGTIAGVSKTNVMSLAAAEITAVDVQVGDLVKEGDPLVTLDQKDIEKQIAELKTSINNANAIAANDAAQKQESLNEAKQDQASTLAKATDSVNKAQASYDELVKKRDDCQTKLNNKKNEVSSAENAQNNAKKEMDNAQSAVYAAQDALSKYQAENPGGNVTQNPNGTPATQTDPKLAELQQNVENANRTYSAKQTAYSDAAAKYSSVKAEADSLQTELDTYPDALKSAEETINTAKTSYSDAETSTNRSIATAQNTVDMQKYQTSTTSDLKDQLEQLQKQLADCTLSAPIGGVVTAVNVSVGDKNTAGTTMITIEDTSSLKVIVNVEEADILKIQEGMQATVTTDATGDEEIKGTVSRVVRVKNQSTNTNSTDTNTSTGYSAEITIDNTELLVGMSAKAKIVIKDRGTQLAVPYDLIQYDEKGNAYVLVAQMNDDGTATAVRKNIKVGEEVDYYTEVTGGDLKEGDQLIYDNTFSVTEGQVFTPDQMYSNQQTTDGNAVMSTEAE
jgi:HlyD family secretion protein